MTLDELKALYARVTTRDPQVLRGVAALRAKAEAGDRGAGRVFNALRALHWRKVQGEASWKASVQHYGQLRARNPKAFELLRQVNERRGQGDQAAEVRFRALRAIHHQYLASTLQGPGEARIGYYPMPRHHRPGIEISPMHPNIFIGAALPLTAEALTNLLNLIAQARYSDPNEVTRSVSPGGGLDLSRLQKGLGLAPAPPLTLAQAAAKLQASPALSSALRSRLAATRLPNVR